jgi:hypothetical protein
VAEIRAENIDGMKEKVRGVFVFLRVVVWKETCNKEPRRERIKWVHDAACSGKKEVKIHCKPKVEL